MAGAIQSSKGSNPYELINIPTIGKLLETAISLDPTWESGSLFFCDDELFSHKT